jgi:hypothetical protein
MWGLVHSWQSSFYSQYQLWIPLSETTLLLKKIEICVEDTKLFFEEANTAIILCINVCSIWCDAYELTWLIAWEDFINVCSVWQLILTCIIILYIFSFCELYVVKISPYSFTHL